MRKAEYRRRKGKDRQFIKGQQYTLLSRRAHLTLEGRQALQKVLAANKRLHTAYLLKESFAQLWRYQKEGWARRFFDHQRRAYGLRDEEYLHLKILTCMLPEL